MKTKLVGFGELLLRLDSPQHLRLAQAEQLQARYTGGEANVLVAAKNFGVEHCQMVSRVPDQAIGHACIEFLNRYRLDTSSICLGGDRLGILFVETGASIRPTRVVYDRLHTGFRQSNRNDYDWPTLLADADVVHITGTAPALGDAVQAAMDDCLEAARSANCLVSFDCSYRSALWDIEQAGEAYRRYAPRVDILFASPGDAELFFGIKEPDVDQRMRQLADRYGIGHLAYTERDELSASVNGLQGIYWQGGEKRQSRRHEFEIVDRIGSGDAFAAGLIASLLQKQDPGFRIEFATAAAVLKHTISGDFCLVSAAEVGELVEGTGTRIRR
ncbi:MAG: sugar kinase [Planctomycetota bacterium]|nr:sugar kinase [Planctomycetota bacterium]